MSDTIITLERLMRAALERQKVLASNIANADTPFYTAKDIRFSEALGQELSIPLGATDPGHQQGPDAAAGGGAIIARETQPWADRNNVELDAEVAKMTENAMLYEAGSTLYQMKVRMFKAALKTR